MEESHLAALVESRAQEAGEVQAPVAQRIVAVRVAVPLFLRPVPAQLEAVLLRVAQIDRLVGAVVVEAVDGVARVAQPAQSVAKPGPRRVADRHVVQPCRPRRWRAAALRLPCVEAEVVVVAAGGHEEHRRGLDDDVESEDADVEALDLAQVAGSQVDVADVHAGFNRTRGTLDRSYSGLDARVADVRARAGVRSSRRFPLLFQVHDPSTLRPCLRFRRAGPARGWRTT